MVAETLLSYSCLALIKAPDRNSGTTQWTRSIFVGTSPRPISIGQLHALLHFHIRPINPVVFRGPYQINSVGTLILRRASRLDAFSGYHFQT